MPSTKTLLAAFALVMAATGGAAAERIGPCYDILGSSLCGTECVGIVEDARCQNAVAFAGDARGGFFAASVLGSASCNNGAGGAGASGAVVVASCLSCPWPLPCIAL